MTGLNCTSEYRLYGFIHCKEFCPDNVCLLCLFNFSFFFFFQILFKTVPTGSPPRRGDVAVYVFDINQPSLPAPFYSVLVSVSVFMTLLTVFHSINSPDKISAFSLCSFGLVSALLVLSTICLFMKVSLYPDIILCVWLGLKHQLTN